MTPANASTAMATVLVDELVRCGVRELVLAPGSRSAALAFAAYAAQDRLRLHTRIDERSAGFLALGIARTSKRPVVVVTTSGTAVANLHPAVLEASHAGVPLVLLTADRPARLRGTNANQTTDQVRIFGTAVRHDADVPSAHPGSGPAEVRQVVAWRALAARAAAVSRGRVGGRPGPVHLNVQFEEPLTPGAGDGWGSALDGRIEQQPVGADHRVPGARAAGGLREQRPAGVLGERARRRPRVLAGQHHGARPVVEVLGLGAQRLAREHPRLLLDPAVECTAPAVTGARGQRLLELHVEVHRSRSAADPGRR